MRARLRQILRTLRRDESGQSLIVVVSSMTVMLGVAGFGIDTATWMVRHHGAQVVADSAALAAAECLADPNHSSTMYVNGSQITVPKCTSSKDVADAQTVAVDYAAANGLTISTSNVSVDATNDLVTVNASTNAPGLFARLFGIGTVTQTAHAGAGWKSYSGSCSDPGSTCDFMFANSNNCNGANALSVALQGNASINGNVVTNGSLGASMTGNAGGINGTGTYGPGSCASNTGGNHDPWQSSPPTQESATVSWPIDYSKDFPACPGADGSNPCVDQYPSWCTNTGANITVGTVSGLPPSDKPHPGTIYCASGTGSPGDPSTWNGTITIEMSGNNTITDTFVGGTITYTGDGGDTISACGYTVNGFSSSSCSAEAPLGGTANYPVFYAVGSDPNPTSCAAGTSVMTSCALALSSTGNLTLDGDAFVENGTASLNFQGNQTAGDTFFEANTISANLAGNFNGDGPAPGGTGGPPVPGSVTLVQ